MEWSEEKQEATGYFPNDAHPTRATIKPLHPFPRLLHLDLGNCWCPVCFVTTRLRKSCALRRRLFERDSELMNWNIYRFVKDQIILRFKYSGSLTWYLPYERRRLTTMSSFAFATSSSDMAQSWSCWERKRCPWRHSTRHPQLLWCDASAPFVFALISHPRCFNEVNIFGSWLSSNKALYGVAPCSSSSFFLCVHPQLTMSLWKEFLSFKASTACCFSQLSRYKDWSKKKTPGTFLHITVTLFCHSECTLWWNELRVSRRVTQAKQLAFHLLYFHHRWSKVLFRNHWPLQPTSILTLLRTSRHQNEVTSLTAPSWSLEFVCGERPVVLWLLFGCTPEAV